MSTQRIQLRRTKGWRKPDGVVVVSRPTRWGNPWRVVHRNGVWGVLGRGEWMTSAGEPWTRHDAQMFAVERFSDLHRSVFDGPNKWGRSIYTRDAQIILGGKDLACWCSLGQPCHADVLLEIANEGQL